jgi:nicotinamidase-related amidase
MKALIVVDAQNDFVTGPLGTKEAQAAIPNIKKLIRDMTDEDGDTIIIATQDTHYEKNYSETLEGKKLPVFHCGYNTRGWEIVKEVADMIEPTTLIAQSTRIPLAQRTSAIWFWIISIPTLWRKSISAASALRFVLRPTPLSCALSSPTPLSISMQMPAPALLLSPITPL